MNKRTREIVLWIMEKQNYQESCTIADLTQKFKVSERTIRYDLDRISDFLIDNKQKPVIFSDHGVICLQKDTETILKLLKENDFYSFKLSKEERKHMILYLIANCSDFITLQQLADILFVSRSTIIHDVDETKSMIQEYNLKIVSLRKGLQIQGKESDRRVLLMNLLRLPYIQQFQKSEDTCLIEQQDLESLKRIIKDAEIESNRFLTDSSFSDLLQYLILLLKRYHENLLVENDYRNINTSIQEMASSILHKMSDYFGIVYFKQEEYLLMDILYHLHYLKQNDADEKTMQIQLISKQFIDAVATELKVDLRNDFQFYQNLSNHLHSTFKHMDLDYDSDRELLNEIVDKNPEVVKAIEHNLQPLVSYVKRDITKEEIAYITIHVCAAMERNRYQESQFVVLLVCNSGVGTSQLLLSRLKKYFQFYVADVLPVHALANYDVTGIDLIISTVPIKEERCDIIILRPYLSDEDCILLGEKLTTMKKRMRNVNSTPNFQHLQTIIANSIANSPSDKDEIYKTIIRDLQSYFFPVAPSDKATLRDLLWNNIEVDVECSDWKDAIKKSAEPLLKANCITEKYVHQMIKNIEIMGPYVILSKGFALPHESPDNGGKQLGMHLIRLKKSINFGNQPDNPVDFVCCLATIDKDSHLKAMFHLMNLLSKSDFCENIRKVKTADEIYQIIYEYESIL